MGWLFLSIGVLLICWTSFYPMIQAFILSMKSGLGVNLKFTGFLIIFGFLKIRLLKELYLIRSFI